MAEVEPLAAPVPITPTAPQFIKLTTLDPPVEAGVNFWLNADHLMQVFTYNGQTVIRTTADAFHPREANDHLVRVVESPDYIVATIWQKPAVSPLPVLP